MSFLVGLPLLLVIVLCAAAFVVHFLPAFVAWRRRAEHFWWIFVINFFFGWTILGWVGSLVWALQDRPRYSIADIPPPPYNR